jgi:hypothetical protein
MIDVPLVLPDRPLAVGEVEGQVEDWGRQVMRQALAAVWAAQAPMRPVGNCPACGAGGEPTGEAQTASGGDGLRAAGERIGSGGIEKGEGMVALRVSLLHDTWDQLIPPALAPLHVPAF